MPPTIKHRPHKLVTATIIMCLGLLGACKQAAAPVVVSTPAFEPSPTPIVLPKFLSYTNPVPGEVVARGMISGNQVRATIELEEVAEPGESLGPEDMHGRVEFLLDDEPVDIEIGEGFRPYRVEVSAYLLISEGEHTFTIRVHRTSGEVLEYSWQATALAGAPILSGLPEGLQFVRPVPDSTVTLQAYREEPLVPKYYYPNLADLEGGVCAGVLAEKMVERGEFLDDGVGGKYSIVSVDGMYPDSNAVLEGATEATSTKVYENERLVKSYMGNHHYWCWRIELAPGKHKAKMWLRNASGETIDYTWVFTITDN